ncbi:MAG TPA: M23 family metallopeptidase [Anaeromyxobacteraceae bacterium]|nr:M23 family metallopeptidase [Anaeromyxobacteraceae bacterium]
MQAALLALSLTAAVPAGSAAAGEAPPPPSRPGPLPQDEGVRLAPAVEVAPAVARPGDAILVTVRGAPAEPRGTVAGRSIPFWRAGDAWRAVAPLPVESTPGPARAEVEVEGLPPVAAPFTIVDAGFRSTTLTVPGKFVEPPPAARRRMKEDQKVFDAAWETPFAPPVFSGPFDWPRRAETTGRYGDLRLYNGKKEGQHYGLDLSGPVGAPVAAANDGTVAVARDCYMSGRTVVLWHGAGLFTVYFHLSRIDVKPGQRVRKGDLLGLLGSSGRVTGPHLHWGVKVAGLYVDPESVLRMDFERGTAAPPPLAAPEAAAPASATPAASGAQ